MQLWRLGGQALALFEVAGLLRQRSEAAIPLDAPLGLLLRLRVTGQVAQEAISPRKGCIAVDARVGTLSSMDAQMAC